MKSPVSASPGSREIDPEVAAIERPDPRLLRYYLVRSLAFGPLVVVALPYLIFRYRTMRYRFDAEGVSMAWGALFRREVDLTYTRIQDIHLSSNVVERWLGLARIEIQTASGSAKAEMVIEGVPEFEELRDFLYTRMRGISTGEARRGAEPSSQAARSAVAPSGQGDPGDGELAGLLREAAAELRAVREALVASRPPSGGSGAD